MIELTRRTPQEVAAYLDSSEAALVELLPDPGERAAFRQALIDAAAHHHHVVRGTDLIPSTALPGDS